MSSSIDVVKKLAAILNTAVGYLLDESGQENVLKDPDMLKRLNDIEKMEPTEKGHVLFALDALIQKIVSLSLFILPFFFNFSFFINLIFHLSF